MSEDFSPYGRAPCSVCGREMNLRKNGTLRQHGGGFLPHLDVLRPRRFYERCGGSGYPPQRASR